MKQTWIDQLKPGQNIKENFVLRKLEVKEYSGRKYLSLEFGDKSGRIGGVCWDGVDDYLQAVRVGNIVKVEGIVGTYKEVPQINVAAMQPVKGADFDPSDYLPTGPREPQQMMTEIDEIIEKLEDRDYRELLVSIFGDGIIRRKFSLAPAAKLWHHSYVGGLAEHTLNIVYLCRAAGDIYKEINKDLLIAGALLHDIGKADTYSMDNYFDYSDEGRLVGHISIADRIICGKIARLENFPTAKRNLIRHMVLSHQGTYEQASPVLPQTLEANILYILDLLDARVGGIMKVKAKHRQSGQPWSGYVKLLERYLYFNDYSGEENG
jgi:3'-5' exoribonuclease